MRCDKFKEASRYAREVLRDPVKRDYYQALARKLRKHSGYNLVISEFMNDRLPERFTSGHQEICSTTSLLVEASASLKRPLKGWTRPASARCQNKEV